MDIISQKEKSVYVWVDWESTGLWVETASGGLANANYEHFNLPKDMIQRFEFWTAWFSNRRPEMEDNQNQMDDELFRAYGISLAIQLKLFHDEYRVFYGHKTDFDCFEISLFSRDYDKKLIPFRKRL